MVLCNEVTKWMKDDVTHPPTEGVYVYGLYLEGAGWDRRNCKLIDSKPKVLFEMMPVIRMFAENNGETFLIFMFSIYSTDSDRKRIFKANLTIILKNFYHVFYFCRPPIFLVSVSLFCVSIPHGHSEWMDVTFKCQAD